MILRVRIQIDTRVHCTTRSDFGESGYSKLTSAACTLHLNRVLLTVVHKRNNLIVSLDAIDGHAHLAIPRARLQDDNMVDGFPVSVVQREPFPIRGEARSKRVACLLQASAQGVIPR